MPMPARQVYPRARGTSVGLVKIALNACSGPPACGDVLERSSTDRSVVHPSRLGVAGNRDIEIQSAKAGKQACNLSKSAYAASGGEFEDRAGRLRGAGQIAPTRSEHRHEVELTAVGRFDPSR